MQWFGPVLLGAPGVSGTRAADGVGGCPLAPTSSGEALLFIILETGIPVNVMFYLKNVFYCVKKIFSVVASFGERKTGVWVLDLTLTSRAT